MTPQRLLCLGICASLALGALASTAPAGAAGPASIAVLAFRDDSGTIAARGGPARALRDKLATELRSHGFETLGLEQLASTLSTAQLMAQPPLTDSDVAAIGRASGATYVVNGVIGAYEDNVGTRYKKPLLSTNGRAERVASDARLSVDVEVRSARDGKLAYARHFEGTAEGETSELPRDSDDLAREARTGPGARAIGNAAIEIGDFLSCELRRRDECLGNYAVDVPESSPQGR